MLIKFFKGNLVNYKKEAKSGSLRGGKLTLKNQRFLNRVVDRADVSKVDQRILKSLDFAVDNQLKQNFTLYRESLTSQRRKASLDVAHTPNSGNAVVVGSTTPKNGGIIHPVNRVPLKEKPISLFG
jgi:hypothetical protein